MPRARPKVDRITTGATITRELRPTGIGLIPGLFANDPHQKRKP